jgi:hypothetical protein
MENVSTNWQDSLDVRLVNRLHRPLRQPGLMKMAMGENIINRCDRFLNRLPLLSQQMQRWGNTSISTSDSVPIVYAQPVSTTEQQETGTNLVSQQSSVPPIQRKVDSATSSNTSSNLSNQITSPLPLQTQINQTSISSSEIPIVSPQITSEAFTNISEVPLQAKYNSSSPNYQAQSGSENTQPLINHSVNNNISDRNQQTDVSSSKIPIVSPQLISNNSSFTEILNISEQSLPTIQLKQQNFSQPSPSISIVHPLNTVPITAQPLQNRKNLINNHQNITPLPLVPTIPSANSTLISQPLPLSLTKSPVLSNHTNNQTHSSNPNPFPSPKIITNSELTKQTSISTTTNHTNQNSNLDIDTIATQVERKIMRRIVIESERRGKIR